MRTSAAEEQYEFQPVYYDYEDTDDGWSNAAMSAGSLASFVLGVAVGMGLMYLMDPVAGNRRQAYLRQKGGKYLRDAGHTMERKARYYRGKAEGVMHQAARPFQSDHPTDRQLRERVRSEMGHHIDHPDRIEVDALSGHVMLRGSVQPDQHDRLVKAVSRIPGVREVDDRLTTSPATT